MRLILVRRSDGEHEYAGMDRESPSRSAGVPADLVQRELALEDAPADQRLDLLIAWLQDYDGDDYELLALDDPPGPDWRLLGFDVGERTPRRWSALTHDQDFLSESQVNDWRQRRNRHGLLTTAEDAQRYLELYLESDDPDGGWGPDGWTDQPSWYGVVPVYRR